MRFTITHPRFYNDCSRSKVHVKLVFYKPLALLIIYHCCFTTQLLNNSAKMSLQWTLIATFLYFEIGIVLLMVLPVASPKRWQRLFKSRILQLVSAQASVYFLVLLGVLVMFLLDAIREMHKYSSEPESTHHQLEVEMQGNMRLFRAQRNFYISGFSLFLALVIRRLVTLISAQATLLAQAEANMRQAQSATIAARSLLAEKGAGEAAQNDSNETYTREISSLKAKLSLVQDELAKEKTDKLALKSQAEGLNKEYDRLVEDYSQLNKKLIVGESGLKKDD